MRLKPPQIWRPFTCNWRFARDKNEATRFHHSPHGLERDFGRACGNLRVKFSICFMHAIRNYIVSVEVIVFNVQVVCFRF